MRKQFIGKAFILFLFVFTFSFAGAQQTAHKVVMEEMEYLLYLPDGYESDINKKWPLMVFLHGAGESGNDINKVKQHGPPKLIEAGKKFPFIVVSPQSVRGGWNGFHVTELIRMVSEGHRVDEDRVYLTGLSMGGFGTWYTSLYYPELFAAIVPICGGGVPQMAHTLKNVPVWCFHGDQDFTVPIKGSQSMIDSLKPYNKDVKFTIYEGVGHDSWTQTYANDEIYDWMLSHKRFKYEQIAFPENLREQYAGSFISANNDSVDVNTEGSEVIFAWKGDKTIKLKPASKELFFMEPHVYDHIVFDMINNKITGFTVYNKRQKQKYNKI